MFIYEPYRLLRRPADRSRDSGAEYRIDDHGVSAEKLLRREFGAVGGDVSAVQVENGYVRGQQRKVVPAVGGELVRGRQQDYGNAARVAEAALEQPRHGKPVAALSIRSMLATGSRAMVRRSASRMSFPVSIFIL